MDNQTETNPSEHFPEEEDSYTQIHDENDSPLKIGKSMKNYDSKRQAKIVHFLIDFLLPI